jgi:hypothetical protein
LRIRRQNDLSVEVLKNGETTLEWDRPGVDEVHFEVFFEDGDGFSGSWDSSPIVEDVGNRGKGPGYFLVRFIKDGQTIGAFGRTLPGGQDYQKSWQVVDEAP